MQNNSHEMESTGEDGPVVLCDGIDIKEESTLTDPYREPFEEIEEIYIKEENVKAEISEDDDACDPLQVTDEELKNEVESTSSDSEPESALPVALEDDDRSGGSDSLATSIGPPIGTDITIQYTTRRGESCERTSRTLYLIRRYSIRQKSKLQALNEHEDLDSSDSKHSCSVCHKTFETRRGVARHFGWRHTDERPRSGNVHQKTDSCKDRLSQQPVERPYTCEVCHKSYTSRKNLSRHNELHERPFICEMCYQMTFLCRQRLRQHEGMNKCVVCHKVFIC